MSNITAIQEPTVPVATLAQRKYAARAILLALVDNLTHTLTDKQVDEFYKLRENTLTAKYEYERQLREEQTSLQECFGSVVKKITR